MDLQVDKLIKKHRKSGDLTINENEIEPGWNWDDADLSGFHLEGLTFSNYGKNQPRSDNNKPAEFNRTKFNNAHLSNITAKGANFTDANFDRVEDASNANFQDATFYRAYMRNATFCYADFTKADLTHVYFDNSNFKGAKLNGADLSNSYVPETKFHETEFKKTKLSSVRIDEAKGLEDALYLDQLDESETSATILAYIYLEKYFKYNGWPDYTGRVYYRRKVLRRKIQPQPMRFLSYLFDLICGYGENPFRIIIWMFIVILSFATIYLYLNLFHIYFGWPSANLSNITYNNGFYLFIDNLYFSGVTFTTLGFGDLHPDPSNFIMKIFAFLEALSGAGFISLFVVSLSRKIMR